MADEQKYDLVEKASGEARYVALVATRYRKPGGGSERVIAHVLPQMLDYVCDPAHLRTLRAGMTLREARAAGLAVVIQRASIELGEMVAAVPRVSAPPLMPGVPRGWPEPGEAMV